MSDPLKRRSTALILFVAIVAATAVSSVAKAAGGLCQLADKVSIRDLQSDAPNASVRVLKRDGQLDVCVQSSRCVWHIAPVLLSELGTFGPFADGDTHCQATYDQVTVDTRRHTYERDCRLSDGLGDALVAAGGLFTPIVGSEASCGTLEAPLTDQGAFADVGGVPVFVGSVALDDLCLAAGIELDGQYRAFAALVRSCPTDTAGAAAIAAQWLGAGVATSQFSIGASFSDGGFGLTSAGPTFDLKAATPVVLGPLIDQGYVTTWLAAIRAAAEANTDLADGSVLEASSGDPIGRLAKWLAAGLMRLDARPFDETDPNWVGSAPARDWMTRTLLIDPNAMEGTLLRAENARKPWGAP